MRTLCAVHEIEDGGAKGLEVDNHFLFAVRRGEQVYLYRNSCPHLGTPLEWEEDKFLNPDGELIQCTNHGALFRIEDGYCLAGPCQGKSLQALPSTIEFGQLMIDEAVLAQRLRR